jgi:hypothetical protein
MLCMCSARIRLVKHVNNTISKFLRIFLLNPNFLLAHRNRYLEGTDNGQKTSRGHPNFNSYIQNLHVLVFQVDRWTDRQTDRQTEKLVRCGLGTLSVPPGTPAAHGLEELVSTASEEPIWDLAI